MSEKAKEKLLPCPYCGNDAEYYPQSNSQVSAIYCKECSLGVGAECMSYKALATVWNNIKR